MEQWKRTQVPDYEVSTLGRVRRATPGRSTKAGRVLKPAVHSAGRLTVRLGYPQRNYYVHHLVLDAFVGPRPEGHEANHKDGNPRNNQLDNLEWVTRSQNLQHARDNALHARGEAAGKARLTEAQVREICELAQYERQSTIAERFGVSRDTVSEIVRGRKWRHVTGVPRIPDIGYARGERSGVAKLTEAQVREIRALAGTIPQYEIAIRFAISEASCSRIIKRKAWKHVD